MRSLTALAIATLAIFSSMEVASAGQCKFPTPSPNFTRDKYSGLWYEVAKFQTAGGAYWEKDCVCTQLNVTQATGGKFLVDNLCRDKLPAGKLISAVGNLFNEGPPGHFQENFFPLAPSVDYTIAFMGFMDGEEYSVEYDCGSNFLTGTDYCVHFLSRKPTMSEKLLNYLIGEVNKLQLNANNLPLQMTKQEGCWHSTTSEASQIE